MLWRAFLAASTLAAQTSIFLSAPLTSFRLSCTASGALQRVPLEGQPFSEALRLTTPGTISTGTDREWSCRIRHSLAIPVKQNDWITVRAARAGFLGDYEITVDAGGEAMRQTYKLTASASPLVFTLP